MSYSSVFERVLKKIKKTSENTYESNSVNTKYADQACGFQINGRTVKDEPEVNFEEILHENKRNSNYFQYEKYNPDKRGGIVSSSDRLALSKPKVISWKNKDAYVYTVDSKYRPTSKPDLEFVIYIPVDTAVQWLESRDWRQGKPGRGVPESGERVPEFGERVPEFGERVPESGGRVPEFGERVPKSGERAPESGERVPKSGERVPESGESVPKSGERELESGERAPRYGEGVLESGKRKDGDDNFGRNWETGSNKKTRLSDSSEDDDARLTGTKERSSPGSDEDEEDLKNSKHPQEKSEDSRFGSNLHKDDDASLHEDDHNNDDDDDNDRPTSKLNENKPDTDKKDTNRSKQTKKKSPREKKGKTENLDSDNDTSKRKKREPKIKKPIKGFPEYSDESGSYGPTSTYLGTSRYEQEYRKIKPYNVI